MAKSIPEKRKSNILYIPILKTKAGERWALSHLKPLTRLRIRPLLELHEHKTKDDNTHVGELCEELEADWGTDRSFYLDAIWLHGESGSATTLAGVFSATEKCDLAAVPVVRHTFNAAAIEQAGTIAEELGRGYLLRITPRTSAADIDRVVNDMAIARGSVDLMIDYRGRGMSLAADEPFIPHIEDWRRLIVASGTFPRSLVSLPLHEWHPVPRTCWQTYSHGIGSSLSRRPIFSDYTIRDPGAPPDFGAPSVNLRYAAGDVWQVQVGGKVNEGASGEIHAISEELIAAQYFDGVNFSDGDLEISRVSDPDEGTGNATQWIQWCINHHIEKTVSQVFGA